MGDPFARCFQSASVALMMRTFVLRVQPQAFALWAFLKENWKAMTAAGKPLAVVVTQHKTKRSTDQNRRYWGVVLKTISEQTWIKGRQFSGEIWHEQFKRQFIGIEELPDGSTCGISTTNLNVGDFSKYMMHIEHYAITVLGCEFAD